MHTDVAKNGNFSCSDSFINKLQEITLRSNLSNIQHVITDCPQREKNGWTGDIALSCLQLLYNLDIKNVLL